VNPANAQETDPASASAADVASTSASAARSDDLARCGAHLQSSIFAPGRNCWRIERATRVAFLVDGEEYFTAVRAALAKAQRSFFILGWDIDSRMRLIPGGATDGLPEPLCEFLNALVEARR